MQLKTYLTYAITILLAFSCQEDHATSGSKKEERKPPKKDIVYAKMNPKYNGMWASDLYLDDVKKNKSTRTAQEKGHDSFYWIHDDQLIFYLTSHEGTADNRILMTSETEGEIVVLEDSSSTESKIRFKGEKLIVNGESFTRIGDHFGELESFLVKFLMPSKYEEVDGEIELNKGKVSGAPYSSYHFKFDYIDAGMNMDLVYFKIKGKDKYDQFIYDFENENLKVYAIKCIEKDELDSSFCLVIDKDTLFAEFKPID